MALGLLFVGKQNVLNGSHGKHFGNFVYSTPNCAIWATAPPPPPPPPPHQGFNFLNLNMT